MRTVVTGGAGFIGSHLVDLLVADGHQVTVIDNLSSGRMENIEKHFDSGAVELLEQDIRDADFEAIFRGVEPEVVFHLAAQIDVRRSVGDPFLDAEMNILAFVWRRRRGVLGCAEWFIPRQAAQSTANRTSCLLPKSCMWIRSRRTRPLRSLASFT